MNHQQDTDTKHLARTLLLLQFGLFMSVGLITMILMNVIVSGDSTTPKKEPTTLPSIQPSRGDIVDIKNTTPYTAMQLNLNGLEQLLFSST